MPLAWDAGYVPIDPADDLSQLAGFLGEQVWSELSMSGLAISGARVHESGAPRAEDVKRTYDRLRGKKYEYRHEALDAQGRQVVRDWRRVDREGGTCLDLALLASAQLRHAELRPYLLLDYDDSNVAHALVLANLTVKPRGANPVWPPGVDAPAEKDQRFAAEWPATARHLDDGWVLYDPSVATRRSPTDDEFSAAQQTARDRIALPGHRAWIVDLTAALASARVEPRTPPKPDAPGLLSSRLPPMPPLIDLPSRRPARETLHAAGVTVLTGARGAGKSLLALQAASDATWGSGWFLDGSSTRSLMNSLAQQEVFEQGRRADIAGADVDGLAQAALRRLATIAGPWTVVIDNADDNPKNISAYLPHPDRTLSQHLIIATTDRTASGEAAGWDEWAHGRDAHFLQVQNLDDDDVHDFLAAHEVHVPTAAVSPAARRPLVLRATAGLAADPQAVAQLLESDEPITEHWRVLTGTMLSTPGRILTRVIAELPPVPLPRTVAQAIRVPDLPRSNIESELRRLTDLGLLAPVGREWSMHGLHAAAVQADPHHIAEVGPVLAQLLEHPAAQAHLRQAYRADTVMHLRDVLTHAPLEPAAVGVALAQLADIVDERGDAELAAHLAEAASERLPEHRVLERARCLLAPARLVNQHLDDVIRRTGRPRREVLADALKKASAAEDLARNAGERDLAAKAKAMRGLLTKKQAGDAKADGQESTAQRLAILRAAEDLIVTALQERRDIYADQPLHPDLAKAEFNLGGVSVELAKLAPPEEAAAVLNRGRTAYSNVEAIRRNLYTDGPHRHVASSTAGQGTVDYYLAVLTDNTPAAAQTRLRDATAEVLSSLSDREVVEGGDGPDVLKSLRILAKVALARLALAHATATPRKNELSQDKVLEALIGKEAADELVTLNRFRTSSTPEAAT